MKLLSLFRYQRKLLDVFQPTEKRDYVQLIGFSLAGIVLELIGQAILFVILMVILDYDVVINTLEQTVGFAPNSSLQFIAYLAVAFLVKNLLLLGLNTLQFRKLFGVTSKISSEVYSRTFTADLRTLKKVLSGERINEITSITNALPNFVILPSITVITEVLFMIVVFAVLVIIKPMLMGMLLLMLLPPALLFLWLGKSRLAQYGESLTRAMPRLYQTVSDSILGFSEIKLFHRQHKYIKEFNEVQEEINHNRIKSLILSGVAPQRLMEVLAVFGILVFAWFVQSQGAEGNINAFFALFASVAFRLLPSLNRIISALNTFNTFSNILQFIPASRGDEEDRSLLEIDVFKWLDIKSVQFSFDEDTTLFDNLCLTVKSGDFVGISGGSGKGKTTLVNLVLGFYPPDSGAINVNGKPIQDVLPSWQGHLGYVKQNAFLLSGSIEQNVAFGADEIDRKHVLQVLEQVKLLEWVKSLPLGVKTDIGENGAQISGGQQQRLALARCLYKRADFLVLDEATNALDNETKLEIMGLIKHLNESGTTVFMVSHDDEALRFAHTRYELNNKSLTLKN